MKYDGASAAACGFDVVTQVARILRLAHQREQRFTADIGITKGRTDAEGRPVHDGGYEISIKVEPLPVDDAKHEVAPENKKLRLPNRPEREVSSISENLSAWDSPAAPLVVPPPLTQSGTMPSSP